MREYVLRLCFCSAAVTLAEMLMPDGAAKKTACFVLSLIMTACLLSPLPELPADMTDIPTDTQPYTDWLTPMTKEGIERAYTENVGNALSDIGIKAENIEIVTNTDGDGGISIVTVRITLYDGDEDMIERVEEFINTRFGADADVTAAKRESTDNGRH